MPDLITRERALWNLDNRESTADENVTIDALISATSRAIERYCKRRFAADTYDELYDGTREVELRVRNYPILAVERVAYYPAIVLTVNNASASNQRATVKVNDNGLELVHSASATESRNSIAWSVAPTVLQLGEAINALGNGWIGTVQTAYEGWASRDIRYPPGAVAAKNREADLRIHVEELGRYYFEPKWGVLISPSTWSGGHHYWRIVYTAGYEVVPEDIQEACAQWVAALFLQTKRDPGLQQEQIPSIISRSPTPDMPPKRIQALLRPYRVHKV